MKVDLSHRLAAIEFSKYEPTVCKSSPLKTVTKREVLSVIESIITRNYEKTDVYMEDPELPRYHVTLRAENDAAVNMKVVYHFVELAGSYYYSRSKSLWDLLESLNQKSSILSRLFGPKGERIEWDDRPCFE